MRVVGCIAEFNPFHNGHAFFLEQAKRQTQSDFCVVVMSGNFVQRGAPAIADKYVRAKAALLHGADLVIELPAIFSLSSAEGFARAGVKLLTQLGLVDVLCFGAEGSVAPILENAADIFLKEPDDYRMVLKQQLSKGQSYPAARTRALFTTASAFRSPAGPDDRIQAEQILSSPNNILGIEYIKACRQLQSDMRPLAIPRLQSDYADTKLRAPYASATAIRLHMKRHGITEQLSSVIPKRALALLRQLPCQDAWMDESSCYPELMLRLLSETPETLKRHPHTPEWLANRLSHVWQSSTSFDDLVKRCKVKQITYTAISRTLFHCLLNSDRELFEHYHELSVMFPYIRILGVRREAQPLLTACARNAGVHLITNPAKAQLLLDDSTAAALWKSDLYAAHVYECIQANLRHTPFTHEYTRKFLIV